MSIDAETVLALNAAGPRLAIDQERATELAAELARLHRAAERALTQAEFDVDIHDFRKAQHELMRAAR